MGPRDCLDLTKGSSDVTFQYCIIGESIDPQRFGALVDSVERVTFHHNLWIHNHSRNPKAKGTIQYVNNVIYDWGITGLAGGHSAGDHYLDAINNCLIKGPSSTTNRAADLPTPTTSTRPAISSISTAKAYSTPAPWSTLIFRTRTARPPSKHNRI